MKRIVWICLFGLGCSALAVAQSDSTRFGKVQLQVNDQPAREYLAENVTLYRSVSIDYDTTLQMTAASGTELYLYSQLGPGKRYVLHMILKAGPDSLETDLASAYDVYIDLGDSLMDSLTVSHDRSGVFIAPNGEFAQQKYFARNHRGVFKLAEDKLVYGVSGNFTTTFEYSLQSGAGEYDQVSLSGELTIPESRFRQGEEGVITGGEPQQRHFVRNLALIAVTSLAVIMFALLP